MHSCVDAICHKRSDPKQLLTSAMEAIANARAKTKAEAELKKMRLTRKAKAASDNCADVAAYKKEGEVQVRRSIVMPESKSKQTRGCITSNV